MSIFNITILANNIKNVESRTQVDLKKIQIYFQNSYTALFYKSERWN